MRTTDLLAVSIATVVAIAGIAATKHPEIDIPVGLSLAWPLSLAAGLGYRVLLDCGVAVLAALAGRVNPSIRNIAMIVLLVALGRTAYFVLTAAMSGSLPISGAGYTLRYLAQWLPLLAVTVYAVRRARGVDAAHA